MFYTLTKNRKRYLASHLPEPLHLASQKLKTIPGAARKDIINSKFILCCMFDGMTKNGFSLFSPYPLNRNYLVKLAGTRHYKKAIDLLCLAAILVPYKNGSYSILKGVCKYYYFNEKIFIEIPLKESLQTKTVLFPSKYIKRYIAASQPEQQRQIEKERYRDTTTREALQVLKKIKCKYTLAEIEQILIKKYSGEAAILTMQNRLSVVTPGAGAKAVLKISNYSARQLKTLFNIGSTKNGWQYANSIKNAIDKTPALQLFKYTTKGNTRHYLSQASQADFAKDRLRIEYFAALAKYQAFFAGKLRTSRNFVNNRLDHNFTNGLDIKHFTLNGSDLCEIDLVCSQPTLLSALTDTSKAGASAIFSKKIDPKILDFIANFNKRNKPDYKFKQAIAKGTFYNDIATSTGATRNQAKGFVFRCLFSDYKKDFAEKQKLKSVFPDLVKFADKLKEFFAFEYCQELKPGARSKAGSNMLPVFLQDLESKIFVDEIYSDLIKQNIDCLTKHDSIICTKGDRQKVLLAMHKYLSQLAFYSIK